MWLHVTRYITSSIVALDVAVATSTILAQILNPGTNSNLESWAGMGLLGLVLGWVLMIHIPAKDKRDNELINKLVVSMEEKDKKLQEKEEKHLEMVMDLTKEYKENLKTVTSHCQEEMKTVITSHAEALRELKQVRGKV